MSSWIYLMSFLIIWTSLLSARVRLTDRSDWLDLDRKDIHRRIKNRNYVKSPSTTLHESSGNDDFDSNDDNPTAIDYLLVGKHRRIHDVYDDDDDYEINQSGFGSGDDKIHDTRTCKELKRTKAPYLSCEADGSFSPIQCTGVKCWCTDREGSKIGMSGPKMNLDCQKTGQSTKETPTKSADISTIAHITIKSNTKTTEIHQKFKPDEDDDNDDDDDDGDFHIVESDQTSTRHFEHTDGFITNLQPSLLAGIVGSIIIGLLCAVLLVMFAVYRVKRSRGGPKYQHTTYEKTTPCPPLKGYTKNFDDSDVYA